MNVGIDARWLGAAGVGRYVSNIVRELEQLDSPNRYFVYCVPGATNVNFVNGRWQKRIFPEARVFGRLQLWLDPAWRSLDVFWATNQDLPRACGSAMFKVLTVHDLVWKLYPETMTRENLLAHEARFSRSVLQADRIVAVSEATRQSLIETMGVPPGKVSVIHHGVDPSFSAQDRVSSARYISRKYGVSEDYICTVGTVEPRKDQATLVRALKILRDRGRLRHQLVIAGGPGWKNQQVYGSVAECGLSEREVKFVGKVPEEDLPKLYSGAALFAYPSLYEGFGLPLLEAMACGAAVVSSDAPAMPEVASGAAIMAACGQPEAFADAISRILEDSALREDLIKRGLRRAADFRWAAAAQQTLHVLEQGRRFPAARPAQHENS